MSEFDSPPPPEKTKYHRWRIFILPTIIILILIVVTGNLIIGKLMEGVPSIEELENFDPQLTTQILDRNGVLIKQLYTQRRSYTPISEIPPCVTQAFLAIEDHRFYEHWGFRPFALMMAVVESAIRFDFHPRGASTITQQLAKNLYFGPQRKITRKLRELLTAIEIERYYSKDEILEMYLTLTYFGGGAHGISAAANTYFSKPVSELTINEAAILAAIPRSPTRYNPLNYPQNTLVRRDVVLGRMLDVGYITKAVYDSLRAEGLNLNPSAEHGAIGIAPYFTENVRQELNKLGRRLNVDPYRDGLTVHTTLDSRLQYCVVQAIAASLPELQERVNIVFKEESLADYLKTHFPDSSYAARRRMAADRAFVDSLSEKVLPVQVAFVVLDPSNGNILAMAGGRSFEESKWNRATQMARQPGSCFKPFVYATVLDKGIPITTQVSNEELVVTLPSGEIWDPQNFSGEFGGMVDLREAISRSLNVVSARLIREYTSPEEVIHTARKLGITTRLDPYDALALGASSVIPLEMAAAYQVFQTLGIWSQPMYIMSIDDQLGQTIERYGPERKVVMSEETAFLMQNLLQSVTSPPIGTARGLRMRFGYNGTAGGKTGTTNNYTDAWFIGFTPNLVAACWVGLDDPAKSLGKGQEGSRAALPIWARFIIAAQDTMQYPEADFPVPPGIITEEICVKSDQLSTIHCPATRTEYFLRTQEMPGPCEMHSGFRMPKTKKTKLF
ncbi:PBP1A family penicillin-binding protein [bacterium]|nr:MAG: PBP1A family penicillin-binding protein [bacterium]